MVVFCLRQQHNNETNSSQTSESVKMQVFVHLGHTVAVDVSEDDCVEQLKEKIEGKFSTLICQDSRD